MYFMTLLGIIAPITTLTSADSICHLAEELHDASRWLPRCMVAAAVMNFTASFLMLLVVLFRAGNIEDALTSPTGQPYIEILLNATGSIPATAVMVFWIVLSLIFCAINMVTTSSRQLWAFSRDQGMPFSASLSKVSADHRSHGCSPAPEACQRSSQLTVTGFRALECTSRGHYCDVGIQWYDITHHHRLVECIQYHCFAWCQRYPLILHHFHLLCHLPTTLWQRSAPVEFLSRESGLDHQRVGTCVSLDCIHHGLLPCGSSAYCSKYELECAHLWKRGHIRPDFLLCQEETRLSRARRKSLRWRVP